MGQLATKFIKRASLEYNKAYEKPNPPVTVLMPVFNGEKHLREAIESILNQTLTDFEFLIIDDGSADSSTEIMKSYDDPRIRMIHNNKNMGLIHCLNMGLESAKGKYIARMDCDDISSPDRLDIQASFLEENPGTGVCGTWIKLFDNNKSYIVKHPTTSEEIETALFFYNCIAHPSVMLSRALFNKFNLRYRDEFFYAEDYKLWCECTRHFRISNIPKALLKYRITQRGISHSSDGKILKIINIVHKELLEPFGISPEPDTLNTHKKIGYSMQSSQPLLPEDIVFTEKALPHLRKVLDTNERLNIYLPSVFERFIGDFWFTLCAGLAGTGIKTRSLYFSLELKRNIRTRHLLKLHIFLYRFFWNFTLRMLKTHYRPFYDLLKKLKDPLFNKGDLS